MDGPVLVWRKGGGTDWAQIARLLPTTNSYIDTGLTPGTDYLYRLRAVNPYGVSQWTHERGAQTLSDVPWTPTDLKATAARAGAISLTWIPPSPPPYSPPVINYSIWRKGGGADWAPIALVPGDLTSYVDAGLPPDTQFTYRVRSLTDVAAGVTWSNEASATTPVAVPPAPTGLAGTVISATQIDLSWNMKSGDATAVVIWRKTGSGNFTQLAVLPPSVTQYSDAGLTAGTSYTYQLCANNDFFVSPWSNQVTLTPN